MSTADLSADSGAASPDHAADASPDDDACPPGHDPRLTPHGVECLTGKEQAVEWVARIGYAAKGVVYLLIGIITLNLAFGPGRDAVGPKEALEFVSGTMASQVLLGAMVIGLLAYTAWRWTQAVLDPEHKGTDVKGLVMRAAYICSGLAYAGIALNAALLLLDNDQGASQSSAVKWTSEVMKLPLGTWLVGLAAVAMAGAGLVQFYRAYSAKFMKHLKTGSMVERQETVSRILGRVGFAARGVVYLIIASLLVKAALATDAEKAGGIGEALSSIASESYGPWVLLLVAAGLTAYGAFCIFVLSPYRRVLNQ